MDKWQITISNIPEEDPFSRMISSWSNVALNARRGDRCSEPKNGKGKMALVIIMDIETTSRRLLAAISEFRQTECVALDASIEPSQSFALQAEPIVCTTRVTSNSPLTRVLLTEYICVRETVDSFLRDKTKGEGRKKNSDTKQIPGEAAGAGISSRQ